MMEYIYNKIINKFHKFSKRNKKETNYTVKEINNYERDSKESLLKLVKDNTDEIQKIQSPDEVKKLMEDLWINHKAGNKTLKNNVFMVKLPSLAVKDQ